MTAPLLHPTGDLVAEAWARTVLGVGPAVVGTALPPVAEPQPDAHGNPVPKPWITTGFVVVRVVGGAPHPTSPLVRSVVQCDGYGAAWGSIRPQWHLANGLLERLRRAALRHGMTGAPAQPLALRANYASATVTDATVLTVPRRVPGDPGRHGRYTLDLALTWAPTDWSVG